MAGHFPIARHRRVAALVVAATTAVALTSPLASAEDDLKDRQKRVEKQIDERNDALGESSAAAAQAGRVLAGAQKQLRESRAKLRTTREQLAAAERRDAHMKAALERAVRRYEQAKLELAEGKRDVWRQKQAVRRLVADIYEQGDPLLLGFATIMDSADPGTMTRAMAYNDAYNDRENGTLEGLKVLQAELAERRDAVEERREVVAQERERTKANVAVKRDLEESARKQAVRVQDATRKHAAASARANRIKHRDQAVLRRLQKQEQSIARQLQAKAAAARGSGGNRGGFLNYPVSAPITSPFGWRVHPVWGDRRLHAGIDFGAPCGTPEYAAATGRVMAMGGGDWDPKGNWLIINHGAWAGVNLTTNYYHATRYVVSTGQWVKRGQLIGYTGTTGWSTGCHLHFGVRENGAWVDPMRWL